MGCARIRSSTDNRAEWKPFSTFPPSGISYALRHDFPNICYLTGMESVLFIKHSAVVPREGDPILLSEEFEMPNALYSVWTEDRASYASIGSVLGDTSAAGSPGSRGTAAIEMRVLRVPLHERLVAALSDATLIDASDVVDQVKVIQFGTRDSPPANRGRIDGQRNGSGARGSWRGVSDQEVARAAYDALIGGGSEDMALDPDRDSGATVGDLAFDAPPHDDQSGRHGTGGARSEHSPLHRGEFSHGDRWRTRRTYRFMSDACKASLGALTAPRTGSGRDVRGK